MKTALKTVSAERYAAAVRVWTAFSLLAPLVVAIAFPSLLEWYGLPDANLWFAETHAALRSAADEDFGSTSQSFVWRLLPRIGITAEQNFWVGASLVLAFLVSLFVALRPQTRAGAARLALLMVSPVVLFAVQRASIDLLIVPLLVGAVFLMRHETPWKVLLAGVLVALGAALKFYPFAAALLFLVVPLSVRRGWGVFAVLLAFGAAWLAEGWPPLSGGGMAPIHRFGANVLLRDFGFDARAGVVVAAIGLGIAARKLAATQRTIGLSLTARSVSARLFIAASAVLVCAFVVSAPTFSARWIFLLLLLPWLSETPGASSQVARMLIAFILWGDGLFCAAYLLLGPGGDMAVIAQHLGYWRMVSQPVHWVLIALLGGWLVDLTRASLAPTLQTFAPPHWLKPRAALLTAMLVALLIGVFHPRVRETIGIADYGSRFLDAYAVLATLDAVRAGVLPESPNPFDPLWRDHKYSDWWLALEKFGLTREDIVWVGPAWIIAFLATVWLTVRPKTHAEAVWMALVAVSPPVILAVERANNDLVIFAFVGIALAALRRPRSPVALAVAIGGIAFAAGLKFYPIVAGFIFVLLRPRRRMLIMSAIAASVLLLVLWNVAPSMKRGTFSIMQTVHVIGAGYWLRDFDVSARAGALITAAVMLGGALVVWKTSLFAEPSLENEDDEWRRILFAAGAILLVACFVAGISFSYRLIFLLWLLPWTWRVARENTLTPRARGTGRLLLWLIPLVAWLDGIFCIAVNLGMPGLSPETYDYMQKIWRAASQPLHWLLMILLAGWLTREAIVAVAVAIGSTNKSRTQIS